MLQQQQLQLLQLSRASQRLQRHRQLILSSVKLTQVSAVGRVGLFKRQLKANALNYFLESPAAERSTLNNALASLETCYLSANRLVKSNQSEKLQRIQVVKTILL